MRSWCAKSPSRTLLFCRAVSHGVRGGAAHGRGGQSYCCAMVSRSQGEGNSEKSVRVRSALSGWVLCSGSQRVSGGSARGRGG
jgi:hypothetical protein